MGYAPREAGLFRTKQRLAFALQQKVVADLSQSICRMGQIGCQSVLGELYGFKTASYPTKSVADSLTVSQDRFGDSILFCPLDFSFESALCR
jgi:hypothetical protein